MNGLSLFRGGDIKAAGESLEAADTRIGIIEQYEDDLALEKEIKAQQS